MKHFLQYMLGATIIAATVVLSVVGLLIQRQQPDTHDTHTGPPTIVQEAPIPGDVDTTDQDGRFFPAQSAVDKAEVDRTQVAETGDMPKFDL